MLRYLSLVLVFLSLVSFRAVSAQVEVSVELPINGRSQDELKVAAFIEVKDKASELLPTVIVGIEKQVVTDELSHYSQVIKGLDAGALKIKVLQEIYSPKTNLYVMDAEVELDEKLSLSLIRDIQAGQQAIKQLKTAYDALDGKTAASVQQSAAVSSGWSIQIPDDLSKAWFSRPTDAESQEAEQKYKRSMLALLYAKYQDAYLGLVRMAIESERTVRVSVPFDWEGWVEKPMMDAIDLKLGRSVTSARRVPLAEPCLVEYRLNSHGKMVAFNDISIRKDPFNTLVSTAPKSAYTITARLTNLYDEMSPDMGPNVSMRSGEFINSGKPTGVDRNLMGNASGVFKVKFCYKDPGFYADVLRARSTIEGLSKR